MKNTHCQLTTFYCLLFTAFCFGQDIHFSQYTFSSASINPAMTAAYKDIQATIQHKEHWQMVDGYRTSAATFEMKLGQLNWVKQEKKTGIFSKKLMKGLALGINLFSDKAGDGNMKTTQGNLSIAYHALLNKNNTLSAGLIGGIAQRSISPDGLRWNSQYGGGNYDPTIASGENFSNQSFVHSDFGAGLLWSYGDGSRYMTANDQKHINAGVSIYHLNNPKQSFIGNTSEKLKWKYTFHANSLFGINNTNYSIGPSLFYMKQGTLQEFTAGMLVKYQLKENSKYTGNIKGSAISLGCYYRNKDAVIPYLMFELNAYSIGISYDTNISALTDVTSGRGGFEITLRFNTPNPFLYQTKSMF